jgi:hypothetical protein
MQMRATKKAAIDRGLFWFADAAAFTASLAYRVQARSYS